MLFLHPALLRSARLLLLLAAVILLRGLAIPTHAQPMTGQQVQAEEPRSHAGHAGAHGHAQTGKQVCQISCDLALAPALPLALPALPHAAPAILHAILYSLPLGEARPPEQPPPIA